MSELVYGLISDDFNRANADLSSSPSAEGWAWSNVGFNSIDIASQTASTSGAIGWRRYRADAIIADPSMAAEIDVLAGSQHSSLLLKVIDGNNFVYCLVLHETGEILIRGRIAGSNQTLASTTIAPFAPPYKLGFYQVAASTAVYIDDVQVLVGGMVADPVILLGHHAGISIDRSGSGPAEYDNFNAGSAFELGGQIGASAPVTDDSNPDVLRRILDEQRRANLLGGRMSTILTSALGLSDTVPTARVHLLGRC